ncbi:MAG: phospho-N-acetylmuramoyl-pentapeptide-transferase [Ignavibacteria bacterium]|jgi:phospho-N-acetylmuramoyl-pentapeptide-transferase|nr:phospho-N-acetylmuramoyl-pentapeptide-transferase [Ignavibacteria bacterium]
MFNYIVELIETLFSPPGMGVFHYLTFRAAASAITALVLSVVFAPPIIRKLKSSQHVEQNKVELTGVGTHSLKAGTPTMGGLIILLAVLVPTILWARIENAFVILALVVTAFLGGVGFLDDYLKVVKKFKKGLIGKYKLVGQIFIGLVVGITIYFFPDLFGSNFDIYNTVTTVPFVKNINLDFGYLYIPIMIFIITATSNAVNLTDGLDGLAIGTVGVVALALALICYVTGNAKFAEYLNIMNLQGAGELTVFCAAIVGASLGFLWYNGYPAQIFMGDTGSLALGGAIGVLCVLVKKEFLLPILGGVFFAETLSVIIQVTYFKYTKKKYGEGRRIFLIAPVHHHFEKKGIHESKIVLRYYIVAVILAIIALATFKVR